MKNGLLIFFMLLSISFAISCIVVINQLKKIRIAFTKILLENFEFKKNFDIIKTSKELSENDIHRENFIKFLSDSRDWAFTYIEDVQKGLQEFIKDVDPSIEYFRKFQTINDQYPLYNSMVKISDAYEELKKLLPEKIEDR